MLNRTDFVVASKAKQSKSSPKLLGLPRHFVPRNDKIRANFFSAFTFQLSPILAFTLAEVLITLGIIGVVAAMTIPTLMNETGKQQTLSGYKKAYATLTQTVKMSEAENGPVDDWDFSNTAYEGGSTNLKFLNAYVLPYIKIIKSCLPAEAGCFANVYKKPNGNAFDGWGFAPESSSSYLKYVLSDGSSVAFLFRNSQNIYVYVDINGPKNPNVMGKDTFVFVIITKASATDDVTGNAFVGVNQSGLYPYGYGLNLTMNNSVVGCDKSINGTNAGIYCGFKIVQDGWQLKSDYPW